ncbi:helix-turn-helix domain-containing protein [Azospirillum aestuarii]|uniref:helix-turn-helix domain-containing protein n=1 Tax=Azospirillum aestuarii TaxID=2802052 RepID=UPI0040552E21
MSVTVQRCCVLFLIFTVGNLPTMTRKRHPDDLKAIGNRLRAARLALGLTQKDLYEPLGVKAATWNHWESGKRLPDPLVMARLKELHGITTDWIFTGDGAALPFSLARTLLKAAS